MMQEEVELLKIGFANRLYNMGLRIREFFSFIGTSWYIKLSLDFLLSYLFSSPYSIVMKEGPQTGISRDNLIYGETPLITMRDILKEAGVTKRDIFYDLGSGRGITVFLANLYFGIPAAGIEAVPTMADKSYKIKEKMGLKEAQFYQGDFLQADISLGTIFYIAGTTFDDETINKLKKKLSALKKGVKIITLSFPVESPYFKLIKKKKFKFSWGEAEVYFHERTKTPVIEL
ncbi:MAG: hypothetical protein M1536_05590 [Firmicutes bacterium]|nr:hypothetical protein [Bacillota bacterium]